MSAAIGIRNWGSTSPLGGDDVSIWATYQTPSTLFRWESQGPMARLPENEEQALEDLRAFRAYSRLDRSVLLAMLASQRAVQGQRAERLGVNIGSSRGATRIWEKAHQQFLREGQVSALSSPTSTLGNISSWVGQHVQARGFQFSHSITCSTAMQAILNGVAWIQSGLCDSFLAGGTEAPLTPFTIAQMRALRIYAQGEEELLYPCRAFDSEKKSSSMILGEGAACFLLGTAAPGDLANIVGSGYSSEPLSSPTSLQADGAVLKQCMEQAAQQADMQPDLIITHSPGTYKGDEAERRAIREIFGTAVPCINNKWKIGHTLGASAALSLELAILILRAQALPALPPWLQQDQFEGSIRSIMVNSTGFGGTASSLMLATPTVS